MKWSDVKDGVSEFELNSGGMVVCIYCENIFTHRDGSFMDKIFKQNDYHGRYSCQECLNKSKQKIERIFRSI